MKFDVIDTETGRYPDVEKIALTEEWAKGLIYCDIDCFAVDEDGCLILLDECGNFAYPPDGRFEIVPEKEPNEPLRTCETFESGSLTEGGAIIRIRMKTDVLPDVLPGIPSLAKPGMILRAGREYEAEANRNGAVISLCENGERMGVKPGEFEFLEAPKWLQNIWEDNA